MRKLTFLSIAFLLLAGSSCTDGYYRPVAEAKCRDRGLEAGSVAFRKCVREVEEVEYRYWADRLRNAGE